MRTTFGLGLVSLLFSLTGCARNGVLELDISVDDISASTTGNLIYVGAQLREAEPDSPADFSGSWTDARRVTGIPLSAVAGDTTLRFDIDASDPSATTGLALKVLFCTTSECAPDDVVGEVRYQIERPLYVGETTSIALDLPAIPQCRGCDAGCDGALECREGVCGEVGGESCLPLDVDYESVRIRCGDSQDRVSQEGNRVVWSCGLVEKCAIRGCVDTGELSTYCDSEEGPHFCEG